MKLTYQQRTGHGKDKIFHKSKGPKATNRRLVVLKTLEEQLKRGTKYVNIIEPATVIFEEVPLQEKDITRIKKEIDILKSRI